MYQELARGRDEWALAEVEQLVTIAGQQLQLAGNVQAAVLALSNADARLARVERSYFLPLRKAIGRDLERLRNLPYVDVPGISVKIEQLVLAADSLPVAYAERPKADAGRPAKTEPAAAGKGGKAAAEPWWTRWAEETWSEVRGLVRIQRFDRPEPALLAPSHDFFLRENFKLRLLNARLALLAHDEATFRGELKLAQAWVERHFDARDKNVQTVQGTLKGLLAGEVSIDLPTLNESLTALRTVKLGRERAAR
jgi:uroporphyrin-III C-methyltransferase